MSVGRFKGPCFVVAGGELRISFWMQRQLTGYEGMAADQARLGYRPQLPGKMPLGTKGHLCLSNPLSLPTLHGPTEVGGIGGGFSGAGGSAVEQI